MTDAEYEAEQARVGAAVDRWFTPLGLRTLQRVQVSYHREPLTNESGETLTCAADCKVHWQYMHAYLRFCLPLTAEEDDEQLDYIVRHEMLHIHVHELRPTEGLTVEELRHEERVVTQLAMVIGWVREFGFSEGQASIPAMGLIARDCDA